MAVTATVVAPGLGTARAQVIGGVTEPDKEPVLYPGAVVSSFNPAPGAPLAPGLPVLLFGSSLSARSEFANNVPLPSTLASTAMLVGPTQVPLYFVSPGQINAQIPPELVPDAEYATVILAGNRYTVVEPLILAAVRPALVASEGVAVAQHADSSAVGSDSPAKPGEEIIILATGLGATDPFVGGGALPEAGVTANVRILPRVTIGGIETRVLEAALSPGLVGVYRVRFQIPRELAAGDHGVEIEQRGATSNRARLSVAP